MNIIFYILVGVSLVFVYILLSGAFNFIGKIANKIYKKFIDNIGGNDE